MWSVSYVSFHSCSGSAGQEVVVTRSDGITTRMTRTISDPHAAQPVLRYGVEPAKARLTVICAHGRGASAEDILGVAAALGTTDVSYLAPQARSEEHTSELQSRVDLVCRLLLEKKNKHI